MDKTIKNTGILDPEGKNINPLNNQPYSDNYKELAQIWSKFPAYDNAKGIIDDIKKHSVILVESSTGSGKTVLVPKYALHALNYDAKIAITLPKQIIAKSAAEFAAKTLDVTLGKEVGYQYRGSNKSGKGPDNKLLYATDGTIVARLLNDPELKDFNAVIIDEAHERKVQIDFLLFLLRDTLRLRKDFKLIIMSATIDSNMFESYFSEFKFKALNLSGRTNYPIESIFLKESIKYNDIIDHGLKIVLNILEKENPQEKGQVDKAHDILFFVTSSNEARDICKKLYTHVTKELESIKSGKETCKITCHGSTYCIELYAGMDQQKQEIAQSKDLYKKLGDFSRKLIVSTNVAESSLTVDGVKYVIDSGHELKSSHDPELRAKRLHRQLITHAQAKQRMGRAGRTEPGICYHMYTKKDFDNMTRFPLPDIRTSDLSNECLKLLSLDKINNTTNLIKTLTSFIEPPREEYIKSAIIMLSQLGLIMNDKITEYGKLVSNFGDINYGICLIYATLYNCRHEMIRMIAMMDASKNNVSEFFVLPAYILRNKEGDAAKKQLRALTDKFEKAKKKFKHRYGDHLSLLKLSDKFSKISKDRADDWCHDNFIRKTTMIKSLKYIRRVKGRVHQSISREAVDKIKDKLDYKEEVSKLQVDDRIMICLMKGYQLNVGYKRNDGNYRILAQSSDNKMKIGIDNNTFVDKKAGEVFYNELFISDTKSNLNIVSKRVNKLLEFVE